jgi:hypothetical protein
MAKFRNATDVSILKICYSGYEETILRENYALWLFMVTLFIFWICLIATENDPPEVFMEEYKEKKLT